MYTKTAKRHIRKGNGGILDNIPEGAIVKNSVTCDGHRYAILQDGRIARADIKPRVPWRIVPGVGVVRDETFTV